MKYISIILIVIASALLVFNASQVDLEAPFKGNSIVALITVLASLCAITLMFILLTSMRIEKKLKSKK